MFFVIWNKIFSYKRKSVGEKEMLNNNHNNKNCSLLNNFLCIYILYIAAVLLITTGFSSYIHGLLETTGCKTQLIDILHIIECRIFKLILLLQNSANNNIRKIIWKNGKSTNLYMNEKAHNTALLTCHLFDEFGEFLGDEIGDHFDRKHLPGKFEKRTLCGEN